MNSQDKYQAYNTNDNIATFNNNTSEVIKETSQGNNNKFTYNKFTYNTTNGGLYSGPQNNNVWGSINIIPTSNNYIQLFNNTHNDNIERHQPSLPRYGNNTLL